MSDLKVITFLSLDGVMQAPGGPDEDSSGGFELGGWQAPFIDDEANRMIDDLFAHAGALLLGRKTYEIFSGYWPKQTNPKNQVAGALNRLPKYVVSRSLRDPTWNNSTVVRDDVATELARIKREAIPRGKELHVWGSGDLVRTLATHELVDEYLLWFHPIVLGSGKQLFAPGFTSGAFDLVGSQRTQKGVTVNRYRRAGKVKRGTIGGS